jgi:hypothetical protein
VVVTALLLAVYWLMPIQDADTARVVVTIQTLLDLAVRATTARLLFHTATAR